MAVEVSPYGGFLWDPHSSMVHKGKSHRSKWMMTEGSHISGNPPIAVKKNMVIFHSYVMLCELRVGLPALPALFEIGGWIFRRIKVTPEGQFL